MGGLILTPRPQAREMESISAVLYTATSNFERYHPSPAEQRQDNALSPQRGPIRIE